MTLPPLPPIELPFVRKEPPPAPAADASAMERILGPTPALQVALPTPIGTPAPVPRAGTPHSTPAKSLGELAFERRLAGPAFAKVSKEQGGSASTASLYPSADPAASSASRTRLGYEAEGSPQALNGLLRATVTPTVAASLLPTRRFLLSKGAFIDCTLPGMTTCITATDTFSADGTVVLLERGTKLVGETRGGVRQGAARILVLWTEARTPTGVVVPLSSPGTDELGRSGFPGEVNRHFWDRFAAAVLLTVVNGAVQGAVNSKNSSGSVVMSPSTSTDVMTEVLRGTLNISPTVIKAPGDRIQVFVARDIDFRTVYALRVANSRAAADGNP